MNTAALVIAIAALLGLQPTSSDTERLRRIEAERRANAERTQALRDRTTEAAAALNNLKARLVETADGLQVAERRATAVEDGLARLERDEKAASATLGARQRNLSEVLAALQSLERARPPALAVSPDDAGEAALAAVALAAITPELRAEADSLRVELARIARLQTRMAEERKELVAAETALAERRRLLEDLLTEREAAQRQDAARLRQLEAEDARLAREATTLRELIVGIDARGRTAAEATSTPDILAALPARFTAARARLPMPAAGRVVGSFGDATEGGGRTEYLAIATRPGAVVTSPFAGRVDWAEPFGRLGNVVIVDVGEEYRLVLVGIGRLEVRRGAEVRAGEPIGVMADQAVGQLQFQIRRRNVPIDPAPWLRTATASVTGDTR